MDLEKIVAELEQERDRINEAINLLKSMKSITPARKAATAAHGGQAAQKPRGALTPEGRRRISEAMKKRWAERRKKSKVS